MERRTEDRARGPHPPTSAIPRSSWALAVAATATLGLFRAPQPLGGDQAVFTLSARQGGALYRDFWDLKQPGIHLLYRLVGSLSPSAWFLHLVELAILLFAGVWLARLLAPSLRRPELAPLALLTTTGFYFMIAVPLLQTQIESVVWLAIVAAFAPFLGAGGRRAWVAAGVAAGVVVLFKALYGLLVLGFVVIALRDRPGDRVRRAGEWLAGAALAPLLTLAWLAESGGLSAFLWTTFVYPLKAAAFVGANTLALVGSVGWFVKTYALLVPLGAWGLWALARDRRPLFPYLAWWCVASAIVTGVQVFSWWRYHFLLFGPPLGALAVIGLDDLLGRARFAAKHPRLATALLALLLVAGGVRPAASNLRALLEHDLALTVEGRLGYAARISPQESQVRQALAALEPAGAHAGSIYAFADPRVILYSGRRQAYALNTYSYDVMTPSQWETLERDLDERPPALLYFDDTYRPFVERFRPKLLHTLDRRFAVLVEAPGGRWLTPKSLGRT